MKTRGRQDHRTALGFWKMRAQLWWNNEW